MLIENILQTVRLNRVRIEKRRELKKILNKSAAIAKETTTNAVFFFV